MSELNNKDDINLIKTELKKFKKEINNLRTNKTQNELLLKEKKNEYNKLKLLWKKVRPLNLEKTKILTNDELKEYSEKFKLKNPIFIRNSVYNGKLVKKVWSYKLTKLNRIKRDLIWEYYSDRNKQCVEYILKKFDHLVLGIIYSGEYQKEYKRATIPEGFIDKLKEIKKEKELLINKNITNREFYFYLRKENRIYRDFNRKELDTLKILLLNEEKEITMNDYYEGTIDNETINDEIKDIIKKDEIKDIVIKNDNNKLLIVDKNNKEIGKLNKEIKRNLVIYTDDGNFLPDYNEIARKNRELKEKTIQRSLRKNKEKYLKNKNKSF